MGGSFPFATFDRDHSFEKEFEFRNSDNLSNNSSPDRAYHQMIPQQINAKGKRQTPNSISD